MLQRFEVRAHSNDDTSYSLVPFGRGGAPRMADFEQDKNMQSFCIVCVGCPALPCSAIVDLIEGLAAILLVEGPARRPRSHGGIIFGRWQASKESARATIDADRDRYMALDSPAIS
jgi:hypothetical protein